MATKTNVVPSWITNMAPEYKTWGMVLAKIIKMPTMVFPDLDRAYNLLLNRSSDFAAFFESLPKADRADAKRKITNFVAYQLFEMHDLYNQYRGLLQKGYINTVEGVPRDLRKAVMSLTDEEHLPLFANLARTRFGNQQITALGRAWVKDSIKVSPAVSDFMAEIHQAVMIDGKSFLDKMDSDREPGESVTMEDLTSELAYELRERMLDLVCDLHTFRFENADGRVHTEPGPLMNDIERHLVRLDRELKGFMPFSGAKVYENQAAFEFLKGLAGSGKSTTFTVWVSKQVIREGRKMFEPVPHTFSNVSVISFEPKDFGYEFELKTKSGKPIGFFNGHVSALVAWESPKWFSHKLVRAIRRGDSPEKADPKVQEMFDVDGDLDSTIADIRSAQAPKTVTVNEESDSDQE